MVKVNERLLETVPKFISHEIKQFCQKLASANPMFVQVKPTPSAVVEKCHKNVAEHVAAAGGELVLGWIIWQSELLIHAECHSVWRNQETLFDITPKPDREKKILFLPDSSLSLTGYMIPSKRIARVENPVLKKLIQTYERLDASLSQHKEDDPIPEGDQMKLRAIKGEIAVLNGQLL